MKFISSNEVNEPGIYLCRHAEGHITFENVETPNNDCYLENCHLHGPLTNTDAYDLYQIIKTDD